MLIKNVTLHLGNAAVIDKGWLTFDNGTITGGGPMDTCPDALGELDATGLHLSPGLIDAHCHIGIYADSTRGSDLDVNELTEAVTPHVRAIDAINPFDRGFADARAGGVTAVMLSPGSANPICGEMVVVQTHGRRIDDMVLLAEAGMKMALGENPKYVHGAKRMPTTRMGTAAVIREALSQASAYIEREGKSNIRLRSLKRVLNKGLPVHCHAHRADDMFTALRIAKEFDLDLTIVHGTDCAVVADLLAAEKVPVIVGPLTTHRSKPETANREISNPGALVAAGSIPAVCTDAPVVPIEYLTHSAAMACKAGNLTLEQGLHMITGRAADILHIGHLTGRLKAGLRADLALWSCHPLAQEAKLCRLYIAGERVV